MKYKTFKLSNTNTNNFPMPIRVLFLLCCTTIYSQIDSIQTVSIDSVIITTTRLQESQLTLPLSTTKLNISETQAIRQQLSFQEYLNEVPGLFSLNANNYSQDLRISLRGFGSRSAFGIRGIKLLVDGIPETTPDGQGQLDNLNLAFIKDIEVIRGPSATLYGNASGGIISISTMNTVTEPFLEADISVGNYGFQKYQLLHGFNKKNTSFILQGNYTNTDGYRDQSGFENYNVDAKITHRFSENSKLNLLINYTNSPYAEDAGGLTLEELTGNRRQARQRNVDFRTEEAIKQFKIGSSYELKIKQKNNFSTYGFFATRDFYGKLPFEFGGVIDLQRNYFGNGSSFEFSTKKNRLQVGYDWAIQNDNRKRFKNLSGEQGDMTLDQLEQFSNLGIYFIDHWTLDKFLIRGGVRYDINKLEAADEFLGNGDASGEIKLNAFNPSVGLTYRLNSKQSLFTGFSTSFETPTLSELSADPLGTGGFNDELKAQKARNIEIGFKSKNEHQSFEAVVFYIKTNDDLVPYELEDFPDRTFYRNAGSTKRKGLELSYLRDLSDKLRLSTAYTYSDFKYDSYEIPSGNFQDKELPGIPKHKANASLLFQENGFTIKLEGNYIGDLYANDANSTEVNGYAIVNLSFGYKTQLGKIGLSPFMGINNLTNTKYNDNIRINAFGARYYEAAPGINIFGGLRMQL